MLSHIYLFAVQSLVYEKAGMEDVWKNVQTFMLTQGGPHRRAIEILEIEGRDAILKELK